MRLLLLRHTKSDWADETLSDIERPLNSRGKAAALKMAEYLQTQNLIPNKLLCSTAQRTRETLARLLTKMPSEAQILLLSDLYWQGEEDYLDAIRKHGQRAQNLMVLAHNPATKETALKLAGTGNEKALIDLKEKYPTAALAVIDFDITDWSEIQPGTGHLERFIKPRDLKEDLA